MQEKQVRSLGQEDSLEEGTTTPQNSCLGILLTEEPGRLQSIGSHRVGHHWSNSTYMLTILFSNCHYCFLIGHFSLYLQTSLVLTFPSLCLHAELLNHVWPFATPWTVACHLLYPWDFPGKNTGVGCHFLLQGIFPSMSPAWTHVSCNSRQIIYHWAT